MKPLEKLVSYLPAKSWLFLGYSAVVAWTKTLFSSPILSGGASHMSMHLWAMASLALFSLVAALLAGTLLRARVKSMVTVTAGIAGVAGTFLVLIGSSTSSPTLIGAGYVLVGAANAWLLISWQVEMARGGIRSAVILFAIATAVGGAAFFLEMHVAREVAIAFSAALPAISAAALARVGRTPHRMAKASEEARRDGVDPLVSSLAQNPTSLKKPQVAAAPWKLLLIVCALFFVNGLVRTSGALREIGFSESQQWVSFVLATVLATCVGALIASFAHQTRVSHAFSVALPTIAAGCIIWAALPDPAPFVGLIIEASGVQVVYMLAWMILINNSIKLEAPALGAFALLCSTQSLGTFLGQALGASAVLNPSQIAYVSLFLLVIVSIALVNMTSSLNVTREAVEGTELPSLKERIARLAQDHGLTPRETEILSLWAVGHTGPFIQEELSISKNTLKTHLGHIYAKTCTDNREGIISLLDHMV